MHLWRDIRYGLRGLRNQPGFTVLAVLALGLGIGAATTIYSVIYNVLIDPFPYPGAERVVQIEIHDLARNQPGGRTFFQVPEFLDIQEQNHVFEELIGGGFEDVLLRRGDGTEQFQGGPVTPNMFRFLGIAPVLGRVTTPEDARPGAPPVFVMAYKMWVKHFNSDPKILGQTLVLNGVPTTLVGIMPRRFTKLNADLWRPVTLERADPETSRRYYMLQARLKPGVTPRQAQADIDVIARRLAKVYPKNYPEKFSVNIVTWVDALVGSFRATLYTLAAAVGLLLLIACANVANMLLARATAREKEMAIRSAMGAGRWVLVRQLLVESLLLALAGAAAGCFLAWAGLKALVMAIPEGIIPREADIRLNLPVLLFTLCVAVVTALLFGLAPALEAARRNLVEPLKDSGRGVSGGFRRGRLRNTLVVVEVALSLVLVVGAGLLMRTFVTLQHVDLGFNPKNILVARLPFPRGQYKTAAAKQQFFQPLLARLHALPGVVAATETTTLPPYGGIQSEIDIPGKTHSERWESIFQLCSEGYFPTLGLRLQRGRLLSDVEVNGARKAAVINQTLVNRYFGREDPIGQRIKIKMLETFPDGPVKDPVFEIVGVVVDAKNQGIKDPPKPRSEE